MLKISEYMKITEAAKFLGVTTNTLRSWERQDKIRVYRNPLNSYRLYLKDDLEALLKRVRIVKNKRVLEL